MIPVATMRMNTRCPACASDRHEPLIDGATGQPAQSAGRSVLRCSACGATWSSTESAHPPASGRFLTAVIRAAIIAYGAWGAWEACSGKASLHVGGFFSIGHFIDVSDGEATVVGIRKTLKAVSWILILSVVSQCVSPGSPLILNLSRGEVPGIGPRGFRFSVGNWWRDSNAANSAVGASDAPFLLSGKAVAAALTLFASAAIPAAREIIRREVRVELGPYEYHRLASGGEALLRGCMNLIDGFFWSAFALVGLAALSGRLFGLKRTACALAIPTTLHSVLSLALCATRLATPREHFAYVGYVSGTPARLAVLCDAAYALAWLLLAAALLAVTLSHRTPWTRLAVTSVVLLFVYGVGSALLHWAVRIRSALL